MLKFKFSPQTQVIYNSYSFLAHFNIYLKTTVPHTGSSRLLLWILRIRDVSRQSIPHAPLRKASHLRSHPSPTLTASCSRVLATQGTFKFRPSQFLQRATRYLAATSEVLNRNVWSWTCRLVMLAKYLDASAVTFNGPRESRELKK